MSVLSAARTLGRESGWTLSNLAIQKVLYVAQMKHLARTGRPLFSEIFEAWDYGPVVPKLYHKLKMFGAKPVRDVLYEPPLPPGSSEELAVRDAYRETKALTPGQLVSVAHWNGGGWAANYQPHKRGRIISNVEILEEGRKRLALGDRLAA